MYFVLLAGFIPEFLTTAMLFALCFFTVVGVKYVIVLIKEYLPKSESSIPKKRKKPLSHSKIKRAKVKSRDDSLSRTLEIDPEKIDRIYVKKSS